jgi:hypothetical protein
MAIFLVLLLLGAVTAELKLSTAAEGGTIHESLAAGSEYTSRFVLATNTEPYTLPIKIMVEPAVAWMEVSAKMKNLKPSGTDAFSITLKPTGVAVGAYLTQVRIYPLITAAQGAIDLKSVYKIDVIMDIVAAAANAAGEGSFFFGEGFVRGSTFGVTTVVLGSVAVLVTLWLRAVRAKQRGGGSESEGVQASPHSPHNFFHQARGGRCERAAAATRGRRLSSSYSTPRRRPPPAPHQQRTDGFAIVRELGTARRWARHSSQLARRDARRVKRIAPMRGERKSLGVWRPTAPAPRRRRLQNPLPPSLRYQQRKRHLRRSYRSQRARREARQVVRVTPMSGEGESMGSLPPLAPALRRLRC